MEQIISYWQKVLQEKQDDPYFERKKNLYKKRNVCIKSIQLNLLKFKEIALQNREVIDCTVQFAYTLQHGKTIYVEEERIDFKKTISLNRVQSSIQIIPIDQKENVKINTEDDQRETTSFKRKQDYDRLAAVKYAELWWNSYNPKFPTFEVDCTNYISQCLYAGGAPMQGSPVRERGWWYQDDTWSFSWSVAHSLRWFLSGSTYRLRGKILEHASELMLGDIICYDFEGDGRWDHNTIVTGKDNEGEPLVNAHTNNSRLRYWSYEDSYAWTSQCKYKFFRISLA